MLLIRYHENEEYQKIDVQQKIYELLTLVNE